jgi:hypothetical protein
MKKNINLNTTIMKKILSIVAIAALLSSCCGKQQPAGIDVETFFKTPNTFVGKDTTYFGVIKTICDSTGKFALGTNNEGNAKLLIVVTPPACTKVCKGCVGKEVFVKGIIKETVIDEEFIVALENEGNAAECPHEKACKQKKVAEYKEILAVDGIFSEYAIEAKCIKSKEACEKKACCKDGEKKSCCKDGEKKEGCKDGEKKPCCKDGEKKEGCKDGEKKPCCKDGEKKEGCKDGEKKDKKHDHHHDHGHKAEKK